MHQTREPVEYLIICFKPGCESLPAASLQLMVPLCSSVRDVWFYKCNVLFLLYNLVILSALFPYSFVLSFSLFFNIALRILVSKFMLHTCISLLCIIIIIYNYCNICKNMGKYLLLQYILYFFLLNKSNVLLR